MAAHTFRGKQRLCYTEVNDFTDFQGIGHDPLYRRYDSVLSVVKRLYLSTFGTFLPRPTTWRIAIKYAGTWINGTSAPPA